MPHTPGKWSVTPENRFCVEAGEDRNKVFIDQRFGHGDNFGTSGELAANAVLISAAPELLEALKEMKDLAFAAWSGGVVRNADEAISRADKAIAKAEGK